MDEQRRPPDPASRPDPYELAVARAAEEPGPEESSGQGLGTPPLPRLQVGPFRVGPTGLLLGVLLLVGVGTLVRFGGDRTPDLAPSCTTPALLLSVERVRPGGLVEYAVAGPDGEVRLEVVPTAEGGQVGAPVQQLPPVRLEDCRATGRFGVQADPGEYTVLVRRGGRPAGTDVLTVTDPGDPDVG